MIKLLCILLIATPFAAAAETVFWNLTKKEEPTVSVKETKKVIKKSARKKRRSIARLKPVQTGNLPTYALISKSLRGRIENVATTTSNAKYIMKRIKSGSEFDISLDNIIYGIETEKTPITALIQEGDYIGSSLNGYTVLDPYSKKIRVNFESLTLITGEVFTVKAQALNGYNTFLTPSKYISKRRKFLLGRVLSAFASSLLESKINTSPTIFGPTKNSDTKSSVYEGGAEGVRVVSSYFEKALNESKDVAYIAENHNYKVKFLTSPVFKN